MRKSYLHQFPSPIGELHFSIGMSNLFNVPVKVSVPYRGATFLNSLWFSHYIVDHCFRPLSGSYISQYVASPVISIPDKVVSVPYRGATFLNGKMQNIVEFIKEGFPSPIGELHFSIPSPQPHVLSGTNRGIAGEK